MTCIVAIAADGDVTMGGDSMAVDACSGDTYLESRPKVGRRDLGAGTLLYGIAGSYRLGEIMLDLDLPSVDETQPFSDWVRSSLVPSLRKNLRKTGTTLKDSAMLLGYRGSLVEIQDDLSIIEAVDGIMAIGSGAYYARGAVLANPDPRPSHRVLRALEIAAQCNAFVRKPFRLEVA